MARVAIGQERLLTYLSQKEVDESEGIDPESRMRLRSIDVQLLKIFEELRVGRQDTTAQLSSDVSQVTQAVRAMTRSARPPITPRGPRGSDGQD